MNPAQSHIDKALSGLKDFQLETVHYVMRQFFEAGKKKILIADEVGLGKTIVSRGVVAKMYEKHVAANGITKPFTVIYICSNQAIAGQNISKLNFLSGDDALGVVDYSTGDDRLTALAYEPQEIKSAFNIRIKAFTPATSFDENTRAGRSDERALLFRLLYDHPELQDKTNSLKWILKGDGRMRNDNWEKVIDDALRFEKGKGQKHYHIGAYRKIRPGIKEKLYKQLNAKLPLQTYSGVYELIEKQKADCTINVLIALCSMRVQKNNYRKWTQIFRPLLSHLRLKLSECCKDYLKADLFILDEFQRYSQLLTTAETDSPGVELARQVLNTKSSRVLLLSATPFKPYTNDFDELNGESHFKEFDKVLRFLLQGEEPDFWSSLERNRKQFFNYIRHPEKIENSHEELLAIKQSIEDSYFSVMARTERMLVSKNKDAMVKPTVKVLEIKQEDVQDFIAFDTIIHHLNEVHNCRLPIPIEYAKSSPYPLSFLANYQHKKKLEQFYQEAKDLQRIVNKTRDSWLDMGLIKDYKRLFSKNKKTIPNPKIRLLIDETIGDEGWKYLWIPPSISYYEPQGLFKHSAGFTKSLIFSSWKMVPRMIASMVSYEAERESVGNYISKIPGRKPNYFEKKRYPFPLLTFKSDKEDASLLSMNNFMLNYPSVYLSSLYDPQTNIKEKKSLKEIKSELHETVRNRLLELHIFDLGAEDGDWQKWSWFSVILLDLNHEDVSLLKEWLDGSTDFEDVSSDAENETDHESKTAKSLYLEEIKEILFEGQIPHVSRISEDQLTEICAFIVDLCLGSPAVSAQRSLQKLFGKSKNTLSDSYLIAAGFISLFNKAESISVVQSLIEGKEYFRKVLQYNIEGNIQALLDEYFYLLKDSNSVDSAKKLASVVTEILAIRPSMLDIATISNLKNQGKSKSRLRTHYALDFGEQKLSSAKANRQINIREAFNSPFRPFVLASTSIGQEGLDFHFYCKKIVHWNLPGNPIDFEQREGRIHRYKGHVIRLNVVEKHGSELESIDFNGSSVWDKLFEIASQNEKGTSDFECDLVPCWHLEPSKRAPNLSIDRIVPLYPFSKDIDKYYNMLKVLAYYRFTFGQPRQEELIQILASSSDTEILDKLMIQLSPIKKRKDE